jgi:hypothetical protein
VREWFELRRPCEKSSFVGVEIISRGCRLRAVRGCQQVSNFLYLLLGGDIGRINPLRLFEFGERELQIALLQRFLSLLQVERRRRITHMHHTQLVFRVGGIGALGVLVVNQRGVVILNRLGLAASLKIGIGFVTSDEGYCNSE